jgi:hypothetical protein
MRTWGGLFRQIERLDPLERRALAERAEFDRWAASAEQRMVADLDRIAKARSRETRHRTGISVDVVTKVDGPLLASFGGAHGLVSLSFADNAVDIYVTRSEGISPTIHFACQRAPTSSRFPVIVTLPGYLAIRAGGSGYRLLALQTKLPAPIDAVALRAFGLLFGAVESVARGGLAAGASPSQ